MMDLLAKDKFYEFISSFAQGLNLFRIYVLLQIQFFIISATKNVQSREVWQSYHHSFRRRKPFEDKVMEPDYRTGEHDL